jgi:hypothetical protein
MNTRSKILAAAAAATSAAALLAAPALAANDGRHGPLLRASVAGSQPTDPALFGQTPGGAPWVVTRGEVRLDADGDLAVRVRGLIIPTLGTNPVPMLSASVACSGAVVARTAAVEFESDGDARIRETVTIPQRCLAPAVLLNPNVSTTVFIGATGLE